MARTALPLLLLALLAGCGGDDSSSKTTAAEATATSTTAAAPTASPTEAPATSGGSAKVTPLGTTLKVGEPAVIDYEDSTTHDKSIIELTPGPIEQGSLEEDFKNIDLDSEQKDSTPFYAQIHVENVGKGDLSKGDPATYINGVDDRGQDQNEVIFFGDFDRCDHETPKSLKPGESYDACLVYLIPKGGTLEGFHWIQFDEKSGKSDLEWK